MPGKSPRVLVFVVAYNHEKTLDDVLRRIHPDIYRYDYQILVIDDSSRDQTCATALAFQARNPHVKLEILFNPENQGYGGNQKIGYQYAIEQGFDAVALLHGDGQYAPELLAELVRPVVDGEADLVMGTRMARPWDALRGGMPLYKFIGNRILSTFQNRVLGTALSEFHCGYRVYSVKALAALPFVYNTSDFHFDTEIIIQFLLKGLRIREIPIPTYYGGEVCYVNGWRYAWQVVRATLWSRLHRMEVFYDRKFDVGSAEPMYSLKWGYVSSHTLTCAAVPAGSRVLDLGCGPGGVAGRLREKGCYVHGVDRVVPPDPTVFSRFTRCDLDQSPLQLPDDTYDRILLLDILEHLRQPEQFLDELRAQPGVRNARILISVPNVAFFVTRLRLLLGEFHYGKQGILDLTHYRLYSRHSIRHTLEQCGYRVLSVRGVPAPYPKAIGDHVFSRFLLWLNSLLIRVWLGLFAYQLLIEARPTALVRDLLRDARAAMPRSGPPVPPASSSSSAATASR